MNTNVFRTSGILAVAVGAGVVVGAAGYFIYEKLVKEKRRLILQQDITKLGISVSELKRELQEIREAQRNVRLNKEKLNRNSNSSLNDAEIDVMSITDDDFKEEFYDLSDNEVPPEIEKINHEIKTKFGDVDSFLNGTSDDINKSFGILLELYNQEKDSPEILWRLAKCCHKMADIKHYEGDSERRKDYIHKGIEYATKCLEKAPRCAESHKWYAICIGSRSKHVGISEKIKDGKEFKEHVEEALTLNPEDPTLHHLLGRYFFEIASLSWAERRLVKAIYGEELYASYSDALVELEKAEDLSESAWKENKLLLAKCYFHEKEFSLGLDWLDRAAEVNSVSKEDYNADTEIKSLLKKYEHHRGFV